MQSFLSRLRVHYPDEVDDFLDERTPEEFRLCVRINEPNETVGGLIGQKSGRFLRDNIIVGSPVLRSRLIHVLEKAADCEDPQSWTDYALRELVNLVYGGEALRPSQSSS